jgi:hypothetical protein
MLPRCALAAPPRGGKRREKEKAKFVLANLQRWYGTPNKVSDEEIVAERCRMWHERAATGKRFFQTIEGLNKARVLLALSEGRIAQACRELSPDNLAPENEETVESLRKKHPHYTWPDPLNPPPPDPAARLYTPKEVEEAVKTFPVGSGGGLSALKPDHIKDANQPHLHVSCIDALTSVINLIARAEVCGEVIPWLTGAVLMALKKKDGGIRPVAIGEVLRRIAGKCASTYIAEDAREFFEPHQVGVAVPCGAEAVIHAWRHVMEKNADNPRFVGIKVDLTNAFNMVDRQRFLDLCRQHFPSIYSMVKLFYGGVSHLRLFSEWLDSEAGTHQGCPLGSFLFCLALNDSILSINNECPDMALNVWFIDDGSLAGDMDDAKKALDLFEDQGPSRGLHLNRGKCQIVWASGKPHPEDPFPKEMLRYEDENMDMLGSAIGSEEHTNRWVEDKVNKKAIPIFENLKELNDPQASFIILSYCASFCRMVFFMRTSPHTHLDKSTMRYDRLVMEAFETSVGFPLNDTNIWCAQLSVRNGGLGLRNSYLHRSAAYTASFSTCCPLLRRILKEEPNNGHFALGIADLAAIVPVERQSELVQPNKTLSQKVTSQIVEEIHTAAFRDHLTTLEHPQHHLAHHLSNSAKHAGAYLLTPPNEAMGYRMSPREWTHTLARRIFVPLIPKCILCPCCEKKPLDIWGDHAIMCASGNDRITRHNRLRDRIIDYASQACMNPIPEPSHLNRFNLRPDIALPSYSLGRQALLDIAVTCPSQDKYAREAASKPLFAAEHYATSIKDRKYVDACRTTSNLFIPMLVETNGGWCERAQSTLGIIARIISKREEVPFCIVRYQMAQNLSMVLQRANTTMILKRIPQGDHPWGDDIYIT